MGQTKTLSIFNSIYLKEDQCIEVQKGILWVTYVNDSRDYFYREGEKFKVRADNPALIEAIESSRYTSLCNNKNILQKKFLLHRIFSDFVFRILK